MTEPSRPVELDEGVARLNVPEPRGDREALMLRVGVAVTALGVVLVLAGYWGASGTNDPSVQIPYLISGGLTGLALVGIGVGLVLRFSLARLFRYWLARLVYEHQVQTDRTVASLGRIEALLADAVQEGTLGAERTEGSTVAD